ncbi:MAG: transposase [Candidatus Daviesbacteria bacterium]|nr:transposase [Candidatus Daviesbacteria bacterium]
MRDLSFCTDCYYHIYNRGVEKRKIFEDRFDYWRFLETLGFYRKSPIPVKLSDFRRGKLGIRKIEAQTEIVKIYCFCLMPNHFHLIVQQVAENGISIFMRKISDSYTKYFNTKHERVGSLFQGPFKAKLIETDEYLLQLSKYIHRNPKELEFPHSVWEAKQYPYSSYQYYLSGEKHSFCDTEFILSYFSKTNPNSDYQSFVEEFGFEDPSFYSVFIDPED